MSPAPRGSALQFDLFGAPEPGGAAAPRAQRRFVHGAHSFAYELQRASRKSIGIRIDDAAVRVSAPRWVSLGQIEQVLADKADWVLRQLQLREQRLREQGMRRIDWNDGACLPYLGGELRLRLGQPVMRACLSDDAAHLLLPQPPGCAAQLVRDSTQVWMRERALQLFTARAQGYGARLGVHVASVALSSARTRWGSAGADGRLRLHWRLLHFEPRIIDYVVAHEVAHLREMNHGPRFWATVGELYPDWREARRASRASVLPAW